MLFDRRISYEAWERLPEIPVHIPLHWVWGGGSKRQGGPELQAQTSYRRPGNTTNDFHPGVGHMLPQEAPGPLGECRPLCQVAKLLTPSIGEDLSRFLVAHFAETEHKSRL